MTLRNIDHQEQPASPCAMQHGKRALVSCVRSEGLDQPAHLCSLIKAFLASLKNQ